MNPTKVIREQVVSLTDLPNIGRSMAQDLEQIGITHPDQLRGRDPYALYRDLCVSSGTRQDPCVLDTFISIVRFMDGGAPLPRWAFTAERKAASRSTSPLFP